MIKRVKMQLQRERTLKKTQLCQQRCNLGELRGETILLLAMSQLFLKMLKTTNNLATKKTSLILFRPFIKIHVKRLFFVNVSTFALIQL